MADRRPGFFEGMEMPTVGWWEALWPDPSAARRSVGLRTGYDVIDLCSGDGWFTLQIATIAHHVTAVDIDRMSPEQTTRVVAAGCLSWIETVEVPPYHYGVISQRSAD